MDPKLKLINSKRQTSPNLTRDDFDGGPVSLDEIEKGLYLGNLTAATSMETIKKYKITHILTMDSVPLPSHIVEASILTTKYVHISDMPKEDLLHSLDECIDFIHSALGRKENVLVHCYFGVSRSSSVVIAYIMKSHNWEYNQAFEFVKSKRRFVQPNTGFVLQLKLYRRMGCRIDRQYIKYKTYRLRLAADNVKKAKILPQTCMDVIKPDPGLIQEYPEPIVYRCRKCRRIVACKSNLLNHSPPKLESANANPSEKIIVDDIKNIATRLIDQIAEQVRRSSMEQKTAENDVGVQECRNLLFVEPLAWMKEILNNAQGRLNCPKCAQKLGSFSWINSCQCPCGTDISPAFYFIPSKVELSKAVQNLQTTI